MGENARAGERDAARFGAGRAGLAGKGEWTLSEERRREGRHPLFRAAGLVVRDSAGDERHVPIMLRDASPSGFGGVYVDKEPPNVEYEFFLQEGEGSGIRVRIAWFHEVADYVFLLGLEKAEERS